ncbi:MAG TPA: MlaD family protein [Paludibacteraceae bacterium]|nr:MlaD family protein [Paludibacteraceae bacterium]
MKTQKRALRLGIFIAAAIVLFVVAVYLIGSKENLFTSNTNLYASFKDVRGLSVGNNVRFAGINVGTVKDIRIISDTSVIVTFSVDDRYTKYIYKNSTVQIGQEGLMGGKIVLILPGDPQTGRVREGDFLKVTEGLDIQGMLAQAQIMLEEATGTVANLRSITGKIDSGKGDMGNLINNDSLTTQLNIAMNNINSSLAHIKQLTSKVDSGQGDLGKLVNDDKLTTKLNNILGKGDSIMYELHTTTYALNHGEGTLPRLVHDKQMAQNIDTAISKVDEAVVQVTRAAETVANSWIFRLFSKKKKEPKEQPVQEFNVQPGDTIVIDSIGASLKR